MPARSTLDDAAFLVGLAAMVATALAFAVDRNGAACIMCAICFAGLVAGRVAGISGVALLGVALGLLGILYIAWVDPLATSRRTSAFAHTSGGFLVGVAVGATLRRRGSWPEWAFVAFGVVLVITVGWELCEYFGDRILDTALIPSRRDSIEDVFFGSFGGLAAIAIVEFWARRRGT